MKIKVKRSELQECVRRAVVRALNEAKEQQKLNEFYDYDDDDDDPVKRFVNDPKNQLPKRMKGAAAARKAAMADIKKETDAEKHDEDTLERHEKEDQAQD